MVNTGDDTRLRMTLSGPRLHQPVNAEPGLIQVYGVGMMWQVSPTAVALVSNLRIAGKAVVDYENGGDGLVFSSLDEIREARAVPFLRNEAGVHPRTGRPLIMVTHLTQGGFVPLGARLADGRPHPHAGTGFGIGVLHGYPADDSNSQAHVAPDLLSMLVFVQTLYDGTTFRIERIDKMPHDGLLPGWWVLNRGLGPAIPDGEDLLFGLVAGRTDAAASEHGVGARPSGRKLHAHAHGVVGEWYGSGLSRWRRGRDGWRPVSFTPVPGRGPDMAFEPSVIRDTDGSLLFTVRGKGSDAAPGEKDAGGLENTYEHFRVYRSTDQGETWASVIHLANMRTPSPVTINRTADGLPFLVANPYGEQLFDALGRKIMKSKRRDRLCIWPLTPDRRGVESPLCVLDANRQFGPPRGAQASGAARADQPNFWFADHPIGGVFRLGDGRWHTLLSFRLTDNAVTTNGGLPASEAGTWVEEITSDRSGAIVPPWNFA